MFQLAIMAMFECVTGMQAWGYNCGEASGILFNAITTWGF